MQRTSRIASLTISLLSFLLGVTIHPVEAQPNPNPSLSLTVQGNKPGVRISPSLYGVFFEEINHAGDGGLYAETIRNRDFEEATGEKGLIPGWSLLAEGGARGQMALDTANPVNAANPHALRLDIAEASSGRVGVANEGYWGVAAKQGARYHLTLFARRGKQTLGGLMVSLEGKEGRVYARSEIAGLTENWKRFTCDLSVSADDPEARLVLSVQKSGVLWLDAVSLFPTNTFKNHPNGLRQDLAEHIHAMRPAFVRFPGGCYVEGGDHLADAFHWKNTLGGIEGRPGHQNAIWGYRSTDGLGYHEYLQWCEDMQAEPLFVVNCGMSHREFIPTNALQPWIEEALDAIAYANDPATTLWGAIRAKNGHPAPFHLRYIEIGNENGMFGGFGGNLQQYAERYRPFYDAIKARYPDIQTIANTRVPHPMEMIDDHYYNAPGWFWSNVHLYDRHDRNGPKIYVGEYAVTSNCGTGNLRAALAEAAFMTGLERNSDVVKMSSYAPLLVNVKDRKWNPNAIVFDGMRSFGTPSYHVQKVFSQNRPDVLLPVELPTMISAVTPEKGSIGLGTWQTQAEYKEIEVLQNGQQVYTSHFEEGISDWRNFSGDWKVVDGALRQSAEGDNRRILLNNALLKGQSDYTLHLKARKLSGVEGFLVMFRVRDDSNWMWWNLGGWGNREHGIEKGVGGASLQLGRHINGSIEMGRWYDIRIEVAGSHVRCYLDGQLIQEAEERGVPTLAAIAGRVEKTGEIILKVVNGAEEARPLTLNLTGVGKLQPTGKVLTLTSESMDDENSLTQPNKIVPVTKPLSGVAMSFTYTFPARSLTVLRLKTR